MPRSRRLPRPLDLLLRALAVLLATAVLGELTCRFLVLSEAADSWGLAQALRRPSRFGRSQWDDAYWEMQARIASPGEQARSSCWDPGLGWIAPEFASAGVAHEDEARLQRRRPLLLFGDSYAQGVAGVTVGTFARWTEGSTLAADWCLLNYGVGGYGLDQVLLLMERAVARHLDRRPVVVVSLMIDDDLDRCALSIRGWPKPRLRLVDGRLVRDPARVPTLREYLDGRTASTGSMLLDLIRGRLRSRFWLEGTAGERARKQALTRAILTEMVTFLRARDVQFEFLLFFHVNGLRDPARLGWREQLVHETLDGLAAPWSSVRGAFALQAARDGGQLADYFIEDGAQGAGHYNLRGNAIAFQVLLEGLRQHLDIGPGGDLLAGPAAGDEGGERLAPPIR